MNSPGRPLYLKRKALAVMVAACYGAASANPLAPQVIAGQAAFQHNGKVFSITNTPNAIINWQSFSIAPDEVTRFIQQNADSRVLNRITGQDPSRILGALQSNGHVYLINPNGVLFGKDARVDVQGLVASSLALSDTDFLAGRNRFGGDFAGKVANEGAIVTPGGGRVFLVGSGVENSGVITSPQGEVVLAAGHTVQLVDSADPSVHVVVSAPDHQALNLGQVLASGGRVGIYGALVNQRGKVSADSAVRGENGRIVLKASGTTLLEKGSVTSAVNTAGQGGDVQLLGQRVGLTDDAQVDASGAQGGGQVLIGGGQRGQDPSVPNAEQTYIGAQASVRADATGHGNGGRVIAWSDKATRVYGGLSARGGAQGGDGGFLETSGGYLDMQGTADARAPGGKAGKLLLDPTNIEVVASAASGSVQLSGGVFSEAGAFTSSSILASTLTNQLNAGTSVELSTVNLSGTGTGNLTVSAPVSWSGASTLTLSASGGALTLNAAITGSHASAGLVLNATGDITQNSGAPITVPTVSAASSAGAISLASAANLMSSLSLSAYKSINAWNNAALNVTGAASTSTSVSDAGNVTLVAEGALTLSGAVSSSTGYVYINGVQGIDITGSGVNSNGGTMMLYQDPGYAVNIGAGATVSSGDAPIIVYTDNLTGTGIINSGTAALTIETMTSGRPVEIGGASVSAGALSLVATGGVDLRTTGGLAISTSGAGGTISTAGNLDWTTGNLRPSSVTLSGDDNITLNGALNLSGNMVLSTTAAGAKRISFAGGSSTTVSGDLDLTTGNLTLDGSVSADGFTLNTENSIVIGSGAEAADTLAVSATAFQDNLSANTRSLYVGYDATGSGITLNQDLSLSGSLNLYSPSTISVTGNLALTGTLALEGGAWSQNSASLPTLSAGAFELSGGTFLRAQGGDGTLAAPYLITDVYGLQGIGTLLENTLNYKLNNDIDASATASWSQGFRPIGNSDYTYQGDFDGNGKRISNLTINLPGVSTAGLFGDLGSGANIHDLTLSGNVTGGLFTGGLAGYVGSGATISNVTSSVNVTAEMSGSAYTAKAGGLAGYNAGSIANSTSSGTITADSDDGNAYAGGLAGYNAGTISNASASGPVYAIGQYAYAGGLLAYNEGSVTSAHATGAVSAYGSLDGAAGGLIGSNGANLTGAYATGNVTASVNAVAGGLIGYNDGANLSDVHATGTVSGVRYVGGLVADNAGDIDTSYATGAVSGSKDIVGGLVGSHTSGTLQDVYATGNVTAGAYGGGLVGQNLGSINDAYATGNVTGNSGTTVTKQYIGGFAGINDGGAISRAYSAGTLSAGGFTNVAGFANYGSCDCQNPAAQATYAYYDSTRAGVSDTYATGRTTAQMMQSSSFTGFDFTNDWRNYDGYTTPLLKSMLTGLTVTVTGTQTHVYDGTTPSFTGTPSYAGFTGSDTSASLSGTLGWGTAVNYGSHSLTGLYSTKYDISYAGSGATLSIAKRTVTPTATKVYDRLTSVSSSSVSFVNMVDGDTLSLVASVSFADKNVGTGKTLNLAEANLSGASAGNYTLNTSGATGTITAAPLTVTGMTGVSRTYDTGTSASTSGGALSGIISGDTVSLGTTTASFADKNVGAGKAITVSNVGLSGADAGNYTVTAPTGLSASITAAPLTVTGLTGVSRTYDAGTSLITSGGALSGILASDSVSIDVITASYADKNVGASKAVTVSGVTLSGADAGNYSVTLPTGVTGAITAAPLTVSGLTAATRTYDRTTSATATGGTLSGILGSDTVAIGTVTASFADKNAGTGKTVTVSSVGLSGTDAGNYTVTAPGGLTADITAAPLTVTGMTGVSRTYNAGTSASTTGGVLSGIISGDTVSLGTTTASFADKNVGAGKAITVSHVGLSGTDAGNYTVTAPTGLTASITAAPLTVTGITGVSRVYDATTAATTTGGALSGLLGSDDVAMGAVTAAFADKNAGTSKAITVSSIGLSGMDSGNYTLTLPAGVTADITPAPLTVSGMAAINRPYNATTAATTTGGALSGVLGSDTVARGAVTASFADKNAGTGKPVTVTHIALTGADAGNYTVTAPSGLSADITAAPLTVSGISGVSRVYDATTTATTTGGVLSGVLGSDNVAIGAVSASFADKNVGTGKSITVASVGLSGTDAANYAVAAPAGLTASITAAPLTVTGLQVQDRSYNAQTAAVTTGGVLAGVVAGDSVEVGTVTAAFATAIPGANKPVTVASVGLAGADAGNYVVTAPAGLAGAITQAPLATWTGPAGGAWTDSANWAGGVAPVNDYVLAAVLPGASGTVTLGSGTVLLQSLTASAGQSLHVSGGTLTLGAAASDISAVAGNVTVAAGGTLNLTGQLTAGSYVQTGGTAGGSGVLAAQQFAMSGGAIGSLTGLNVAGGYSHTGGTIAIPGTMHITQTGNLVVGPASAATGITLVSGGAITQTGALATALLDTSSQTGVTLANSANHVLAYTGINGTGGIQLVNVTGDAQQLALGSVVTTGGNLDIDNTGGIQTTASQTAPGGTVTLTAHSPITVNHPISAQSIALSASTDIALNSGASLHATNNIGLSAGTSIGMSSGSSLQATNNIAMTAATDITLGGSLQSTAGNISATSTAGAITALPGTSISATTPVALTAVTGTVSSSAITFAGGATPVINDPATVAAAEAAAKAAADAAAKAAAEAAAKAAAEAAAKAAAEAAAKKAAEEAAAKAAAEAAAKAAAEAAAKAAEEAAAKAAAEAAAKAAADAAAKAAAEAAAKAAAEAAAKAAAEAAAKAAEEAAAKAAAEAAAKAAAEAAAKAAEEAAAKAAEEAAAKAAAEAAAKAAEEAAAKAAAEAAARKAAEEAAAKAAAEAAAKKAAEEAAAKAAAEAAAKKAAEEAAAKASQNQGSEPVGQAINSTVNIINTAVSTVNVLQDQDDATKLATSTSSSSSSSPSSSPAAAQGATDEKSGDGKEDKKDGNAKTSDLVKKDEPVKKLYCN